jgi:hypothetical protein
MKARNVLMAIGAVLIVVVAVGAAAVLTRGDTAMLA